MSDPVETATETAKAVQEVAKTGSKAIDAANTFGGFVARYINGPLEQVSGIVEDHLKYYRWERRVSLMHRVQITAAAAGIRGPDKAIPLKFALPLLEGAVMEDDDALQARWANLLINWSTSASGAEPHRVFVDILERLTPLEAQILDCVYALPYSAMEHNGVYTTLLPDSAEAGVDGDAREGGTPPSHSICLALSTLVRAGCLRLTTTWGGGEMYGRVLPTLLGAAFVRACASPATSVR